MDDELLSDFEGEGIDADWRAIREVRELDEAILDNLQSQRGGGARRYRNAAEFAYDNRRSAAITKWVLAFQTLTPVQQDKYRALERIDWKVA